MNNQIQNIEKRIREIMEKHGIDSEKTNSRDIESIRYIMIICEIEREFDIYIPDEMIDANLLDNLDALSSYIYETKSQTQGQV